MLTLKKHLPNQTNCYQRMACFCNNVICMKNAFVLRNKYKTWTSWVLVAFCDSVFDWFVYHVKLSELRK